MHLRLTILKVLALRHFLRRRVSFATHLESRSGLTSTRYLRLMLLAVVEMILTVASTSVALWSATLVLRPWTNWADVHWHFSRIAVFPKAILPQQTLIYYYALWWFIPLSAFLFFAFFSFGEDAMREYGACFRWIRTHVFRQRLRETPIKAVKSLPSRFVLSHVCLAFVYSSFIRFIPVRPFSAMLPSSVSTPSFTSSPTSTCTDPQLNPKEANEFLVSIPISRDDTALAPAIPTYEISVFLDPLTLPVPPAPARTSHSYHIV